jgi:hypothetical protein
MGKLKKSSHQIIALVSVWICCLLLLLSFSTVEAAFSAIKTGMHQAYTRWNSPLITNTDQAGLETRLAPQFVDWMPDGTLLQGIRPVDPWVQHLAMAVLAAGVLLSIAAVGYAVWRIKE